MFSIYIYLLQIEQDADISAKTGDGSIPIQLAASKGNVKLMEILLEAGIKKNVSQNNHLNKSNYDGISVLHRAVQCGQEEVTNNHFSYIE